MAYENSVAQNANRPVSFISHQPAMQPAAMPSKKAKNKKNFGGADISSVSEQSIAPPSGPALYSDQIVYKGRGARMAGPDMNLR